jgi:transposase-like protein
MEDESKTADGRKRWRHWTEQEARAALAELAQSGLSMARFAQGTGHSIRRLTYWRKRLAETGPMEFVPVALAPLARPSASTERPHIEIAIEGVAVRVREDLDVEHLARIVEALVRQPRGC